MNQKEQVQRVFTESAQKFTTLKASADRTSHTAMIRLANPQPRDRVLEIACGPGFVALLFAEHVREVVGLDLTEALLEQARQRQRELGLHNVQFVQGDAEQLPFPDGAFTIVACHKAFHHFPNPQRVLEESARVLEQGGRLVLGDTLSSDDPDKNALHNSLERLRDPSHVKMYGLNELTALLRDAGFLVKEHEIFEDERTLSWWMSVITPPPEIIAQIKQILIESIPEDRTGLQVRVENDEVFYRRRNLILVAVKP
ncbi:MAG: methyltransferase domain-containing protein [Candidatus Bipolaricaulota bacterium]|nr:methyltransferase domain-containing protein [Candidatus Bipolaricaulota bacterium]